MAGLWLAEADYLLRYLTKLVLSNWNEIERTEMDASGTTIWSESAKWRLTVAGSLPRKAR
ncbi:hypothetical protein [Escherichia coli]|uniref:hypothetical protein n=1 Tax=Escherichia coli TaxID=562 RepID=UPI0037DDA4FF